ncbi:hypothetical protein T484DRAFT_2023861 [Baffinella frigidus]|nr:hypothetical protein T484DRAFT_2023861 [Cryptophyta sp. CCMP2293]
MSAHAGSAGGNRPTVKECALRQLLRMRDASKDIFRNLHHTARTGRDEAGGAEKTETLAANRETQIQILSQMQTELHENVAELKRFAAHQAKMASQRKRVREHEAALSEFGRGLKKAEDVLTEGLRVLDESSAQGRGPVEVDVEDLVAYSHVISYSCAAREGWEPNTPLSGSLPPAPHASMMARSRLFSAAVRPGRARDAGMLGAPPLGLSGAPALEMPGASFAAEDQAPAARGGGRAPSGWLDGEEALEYDDGSGRGAKRGRDDDEGLLKLWGHPISEDVEEGGAAGRSGAGGESVGAGKRAQATAVAIPELPGRLAEKGGKENAKTAEFEEHVDGPRGSVKAFRHLPKMPEGWRPGDPILVTRLG